jgi:hypothetical protein
VIPNTTVSIRRPDGFLIQDAAIGDSPVDAIFLLVTLFGEGCDSLRVTPRSAGFGAIRDDTASR